VFPVCVFIIEEFEGFLDVRSIVRHLQSSHRLRPAMAASGDGAILPPTASGDGAGARLLAPTASGDGAGERFCATLPPSPPRFRNIALKPIFF
jgi:hypothetical protein